MEKTEILTSFDGLSLYVSRNIPAKVQGIVVIVHGLAEHLGRYDELTNELVSQEFGVYRFDHRGHGKSAGERAYYEDFNTIIEDVNFIVELAKKEYENYPIFVLGHSMGGFAAACFGTKYPDKVNGIILSGALTRDNKGLIGTIPKGLVATTYLPNELGHLICTDQSVVAAYAADPLVLKEVSAGLFYEFAKGIQWLKDNPQAFVAPTLILHGCDDPIIAEKDSRDFYGEIASVNKELKIYAKLYHEILNEPCKNEIMDEIIRWLKRQLK